jgi:hypothetical protein
MVKLTQMKRLLKGIAVLLVVGAGILVGLGFWLRHEYPPDRIRQFAGDWLGTRLGRQVEISDAQLSLLHGVELTGIRISEAPAFSAGTFIDLKRVRVLPRLLPLLSQKIVVRSIEVDGPRVTVRRSVEGIFNFSTLLSTAVPLAPAGPPTNEDPGLETESWSTFLIDRATLTEGEIIYHDEALGLTSTLRGLDARINGFSLTDPFALRLKAALEIVKGTDTWKGPLSFHTRLSAGRVPTAVLETFHLGLGDSALDMTGTFSSHPGLRAETIVTLTSLAAVDIAPFVSLPDPLTNATLSGRWTIRASSSALQMDGTFDAQASVLALAGSLAIKSDGATHVVRLSPTSFRLEDSALAPDVSGKGPLSGQWKVTVSSAQWSIAGDVAADRAVLSYAGWLEKPSGAPLTLTGSAGGALFGGEAPGKTKAPSLSLDLRAPELNITPGGPWPPDLRLSGKMGFTMEVQGPLSDLAFNLGIDGQSLDTAYGSSFRKPTASALTVSSSGRFKKNRDIELSAATVRTAAGTFDIRGDVRDLMTTRSLLLDVTGTISDLSRVGTFLPPVADYHPRGQTTVDLHVSGLAEKPVIEGQIDLSNTAVTLVPGVNLTDINGKIRFSQDTARIDSLNGKAFGSPFTLSGRIDHFDRPTVSLDGQWDRMEVEKLLKVFSPGTAPSPPPPAPSASTKNPPPPPAPIAHTSGKFRIGEIVHPHYVGQDFHFNWNFANVGPNLTVLSGTATVTAASGKIKDVPVAKKINKLMNREGSDIAYNKLTGVFLVTGGIAEIKSFLLNSEQTDFSAKGHVRLGDMESDLRLMLKLPPGSVRGSVGNWITADDGRPTIEAALNGPLPDPKVKVDYRDTVRRAAQDILKKTLGGWKGKPDSPVPSPHTDSSPAPPEDPLQDLGRNALEKLFKKK